ncbi:MAG: hypothetical protein ACK59W_22375, partial [Pseudanabaena sp.]
PDTPSVGGSSPSPSIGSLILSNVLERSLCDRNRNFSLPKIKLCGAKHHTLIQGTNWLGLSLWLHHLHEVIGFDTQNPFLN